MVVHLVSDSHSTFALYGITVYLLFCIFTDYFIHHAHHIHDTARLPSHTLLLFTNGVDCFVYNLFDSINQRLYLCVVLYGTAPM
jgi:hypothetical protein